MKQIKIKINGRDISCDEGRTIMAAARQAGIMIPGLCGHPDFPMKGNCRVCVVEVRGRGKLVTACSTPAEDGMEIMTENERVRRARDTNIGLIFAQHVEKCATCVWRFECKLLKYAEDYKISLNHFNDRKGKRAKYKFANAVELDGTQCIDCRNCVDACSLLQKIDYLEIKGKGADQEIVPTKKKDRHCILCGQCAVHCPVSSAQEQTSWRAVEEALKDREKIVVAQFAPSIRVSIGEDFGLPYGKIVTENVISGLRKLGFHYVFDVNFGADVTTVVEGMELLERIKKGERLPMITSCCPGWVNYVEFYQSALLPFLTTARSPHIHAGGIIKTYWAAKMKIKPEDISVVSVMPCTAKKYEAIRPELKINGLFPVDHVITTREFSFMMKKRKIDFPKLPKSAADNPLGEYSGAAAIFGGSGGVMEAALRTAHMIACGDKKSGICRPRIDFKDVRGLDGIKEATVKVADKELRVAVVNGIGNIKPVLDKFHTYDYIEVMACPGGCIGGGGQPIPTTQAIREKRIAALYALDKSKKMRKSYENKSVIKVLEWLDKRPQLESKVLHTSYRKQTGY